MVIKQGGGGGGEEGPSYENVRKRKLEENRKKLEDLKLVHLSVNLRDSCSVKTSPVKQVKKRVAAAAPVGSPVRRSGRIAQLPEQSYKEVVPDVVVRPRKVVKRRDLSGRVYASDEAREYAQAKAEEIESELGTEFPSFVKPMLQSHTTGGFWLGLPAQFCNKFLPKSDCTVVLIDENEEESETTYLAHKRGLSAGWRGFSIDHELLDGDALVFQLINPTAFKVYIIRASSYDSSG